MKKMIDSIKYIKIRDIIAIFILLIMIIPSLLFKLYTIIFNKKIWLIMDGETTARDNGYHFFKYLRIHQLNVNAYYVIRKNCNDYKKVEPYGNIIQFGSLKHWLYYLAAYRNISSQKSSNPNCALFYFIHVVLGLYRNRVFLQHGITKDDSPWLYYKNTKFKYFICGAKKEYEYIKEKFGYPEGNVIYTGFSRFDNLYNNNVKDNQILIMPTWRNWLGRETNSLGEKFVFEDTEYYKEWNGLLNNKKFVDYIEKNNIKVLFYPHMAMQKFLNSFNVKSNNIEIVSMNTDIQTTLKESSILITDYSSVYMDFAYMMKPVIYFQFDYDEYREKQLQQGYFDYQRDSFGPVVNDHDSLLKSLMQIKKDGLSEKYNNRMNDFFELRDDNNCERIFNSIR